MKKYYGNYLGIVIQNNDPQGRGRVKIFVPHISPTVYKNWNEIPKDKRFKFLGSNIHSDLNDIYEDLKDILPWSMCASPITGEMSSGRFNAHDDHASISDSSYFGANGAQQGDSEIDTTITSSQQNLERIGEKEGNIYEKYRFRVNDAFNDPLQTNVNNVNLFTYEYSPSVYSNKAKGSFAIPDVGAHVWVFFHDGNPLFPVYFAASYGRTDWEGIYGGAEGYDYPGPYENVSLSSTEVGNQDLDYYKNKFVINQKGGTVEFINSDYRESIKISGYSGGFKEFALKTNVEFSPHNDQKLVLEDQYDTVRGFRNVYTGRDHDNIITGDSYLKIGTFNLSTYEEWHNIVGGIADIKQLFERRRAEALTDSPYLKLTSQQQTQAGQFAVCPVCLGSTGADYNVLNNITATYNNGIISVKHESNNIHLYTPVSYRKGNSPTITQLPPISRCPVCNNTGLSPSSMDGIWLTEIKKSYSQYTSLYKNNITQLAALEEKMGIGGSQIIDITKNKIETIGLVMNDFGSIRLDTVGKMYGASVLIDDLGVYESYQPSPLLEYVHVDDLPGGTYTLNVANRYNVQVGAGGLSLKSYGRADLSGTITNIGGQQVNISSENEVNINGGKRLSLEADIVTLKNKQSGQIFIDSNAGINGNVIVRGGMHVDGEMSLNHITAPTEFQETELTQLFGKLLKGLKFDAKLEGFPDSDGDTITSTGTITLTTDSNDDKVQMYDHSHHFRNIPLTLTNTNEEVRKIAKANNESSINAATAVNNRKKTFNPDDSRS